MKLKEVIDPKTIDTKLQYHDELNPKIWSASGLNEKVHAALMRIAAEYIEFIHLPASDIKDIILTGSNANYNWTALSDLDLHIVADFTNIKCDFLEDYLQTKKTLWNDSHKIKIYGYDVELYAQPVDDTLVATGVYSLMNNKWLIKPNHQELNIDNFSVQSKAAEIMDQIDNLMLSDADDVSAAEKIKDKIWRLRQAGLQHGGEFSVENLAFKTIRNNGYIQHLSDYLHNAKDKSLSLEAKSE